MEEDNRPERPGYYAVIPADVRYDTSLPPNAKLLYGEISALIGKDGFCYASNQYFAELYGVTEVSITRLISKLVDRKYIIRELRKDKTGKVICRKLWLSVSVPELQPPNKNDGTSQQSCGEGTNKNVGETNTSNTNIKAAPEKKPKPSLTDGQLKELSISWISAHGAAWASSEKNSLYAAILRFYEPRETKHDSPKRTKAGFTALGNRLVKYGEQNPAVMIEMLDLATSSGWKSVYPLKENQAPAETGPQEKEQWL